MTLDVVLHGGCCCVLLICLGACRAEPVVQRRDANALQSVSSCSTPETRFAETVGSPEDARQHVGPKAKARRLVCRIIGNQGDARR